MASNARFELPHSKPKGGLNGPPVNPLAWDLSDAGKRGGSYNKICGGFFLSRNLSADRGVTLV